MTRRGRAWVAGAIVVLGAGAALAVAWGTPPLVGWALVRAAETQGLAPARLRVVGIGPRHLTLADVALGPGPDVYAARVELSWSLASLWAGELERVEIATLAVSGRWREREGGVQIAGLRLGGGEQDTGEEDDTTTALLPVRRLRAGPLALALESPAGRFTGAGAIDLARLAAGGLAGTADLLLQLDEEPLAELQLVASAQSWMLSGGAALAPGTLDALGIVGLDALRVDLNLTAPPQHRADPSALVQALRGTAGVELTLSPPDPEAPHVEGRAALELAEGRGHLAIELTGPGGGELVLGGMRAQRAALEGDLALSLAPLPGATPGALAFDAVTRQARVVLRQAQSTLLAGRLPELRLRAVLPPDAPVEASLAIEGGELRVADGLLRAHGFRGVLHSDGPGEVSLEAQLGPRSRGRDDERGVVSGRLELSATLEPRRGEPGGFAGRGRVVLRDGGFTGSGLVLRDVAGALELVSLWPLRSARSQRFRFVGRASQLALRDGAVAIRVGPGWERIAIESLDVGVVGGTLHGEGTLDLDGLDLSLVLALRDLSLAGLVAVAGRDDLGAAGRISGTIPVEVHDGVLQIKGGRLAADPPAGRLRYRPPTPPAMLLSAGEQGELVLRALEDFHYEKLEVELGTGAGGEGRVQLALRGRNPALEGGREVQLNLDLSGPLLALLQSDPLLHDLLDRIGKRLAR